MIELDYSKISNITVDGINTRDYPDFCDAYIADANYGDRSMTEEELEVLNNDSDFVYNAVWDWLF